MSRLECSECHDICDTTARTIVLPFVCDECQKAPGLLAAMAPLQIEESDNHACDSASVENTTLLIEDLSNQLALSQVEAETLRTLLLAVENANEDTTRRLRENVENLLVKNFLKDEQIEMLNSKQMDIIKQLHHELAYASSRIFALAADKGRLEHERDVWQKRALLARRCFDRASADRRYYRGKLNDAGIKA